MTACRLELVFWYSDQTWLAIVWQQQAGGQPWQAGQSQAKQWVVSWLSWAFAGGPG